MSDKPKLKKSRPKQIGAMLEGARSIHLFGRNLTVGIFPSIKEAHPIAEHFDLKAMRSDWQRVEEDARTTFDHLIKEKNLDKFKTDLEHEEPAVNMEAIGVLQTKPKFRYSLTTLPPPEELAKYKDILPELPRTLMKISEIEYRHTHNLERGLLESEYKSAEQKQRFAAIISIICLISSVILVLVGSPLSASIIAVATLLSTVGLVYSKFFNN